VNRSGISVQEVEGAMPSSYVFPILVASLVIAALVVLLAATRKSLSGLKWLPGSHAVAEGKYPSGYWMSIGIAVGVALGILLGLALHALAGGISIGIGVGLILGKALDNRYDKVDETQFTEEQKQERLRRAGWGLIVMILMVLATLLALVVSLLK
jgi:hypothetical protein